MSCRISECIFSLTYSTFTRGMAPILCHVKQGHIVYRRRSQYANGQWRSSLKLVHQPYLLAYQFLPRDAMRKRGLCCRPMSVRLSIRLSVTLVHFIQTPKISSNFFVGSVSPSL